MRYPTFAPRPRARRLPAAGLVFCLALGGCSGVALPPGFSGEPSEALLSGERLFGEPVSVDEAPDFPVLEPSDAMRAFVARLTSDTRVPSVKFRQLFAGLAKDGYFESVYSADSTLTAAETFEAKGGNCLSYTNMFIALAREAGLDAVYQVVDVPPSWDADSGFLIRYAHINVLLKNVRGGPFYEQPVTIDFNMVHPDAEYPRHVVSDDYARSLFYANHSVALMRKERSRESFAHLRRAIEAEPTNIDLWINLGAFYATWGDYASSVEAYHAALKLDRNSKSAFSGLARSYANAGNSELAELYRQKVRNYRERNPYYHYALAQAAYEDALFERSLEAINTAISLKRRSARFYLFKGVVEKKLGQDEAAEASLRRATRFGLDQRIKLEMLQTLAALGET